MRTTVALAIVLCVGCGPTKAGDDDGQSEGLVSIEVLPANGVITYTGTPASLDYQAIGHYDDGHSTNLTGVVFSVDSDAALLGSLTSATFTASGTAAGKGQIQATLDAVSGATGVMVVMHPIHLGDGVPSGADMNFPDQPPAGAASPLLDYPLDGAIMPSSVKAPDAQWEGPIADADLFRVRWSAGLATVDTIVAAPVAADFLADARPLEADWQALIASSKGDPISVRVDHWDATTGAQAGTPAQVRVIPADVIGAIYYWDLSQGQMQRIDANGRALAIPNPPKQDPSIPNPDQCVACHAVSRDGRYLSGALWGGGEQGAVFDLSDPLVVAGTPGTDATAPTMAPVTATSYHVLFSTFSPDDSRLVINNGTSLDLIDPMTGTTVAQQGTPMPTTGMAHPSWSPDGSMIAVVGNTNNPGGWGVDYTAGVLQIIPVTAPDTFGAPTTIAPSDATFPAPSWPSFSPDSSHVAYAAGVNSRGRAATDQGEISYPGALFVISKDGAGGPVRLDTACASGRNCFLPNFSPFDQGGYYWMVFYSLRDYGNAKAGTKGTTRRQMWITAIDKTKLAAGIDASSVPYWLPDQDPATENMSAFWSVAPPIQ